jgi:N-acetyl sugar amidotransferase
MPNTRPRVVFDAEGVCNACRYAEEKSQRIDWDARRKEFLELIAPYKSRQPFWNCIVPWSGGKDSSYVAYQLKFEFGMNPLLVTFSPQVPTEVGVHNREQMIQLGFDHYMHRPNQKVHRYLSRRFFIERGNQKVAWDAGVNAVPVQMAAKMGIPLVFYAEHGESEYGGKVINEQSKKIRDITEVLENQIGDNPSNWVDDEVSAKDLNGYVYPDIEEVHRVGVKAVYFGYFFKWSMYRNYEFIKSKIDFKVHPKDRTPGTFTSFDSLDDKSDNLYYYMQFIKFGFGRTIRDASRMIQNKQMTRAEGLRLARLYDGEFCDEYLPDMLEYLSLTRKEFDEIVDKHRNLEIWVKGESGWKIRHQVQ